MDDLKKSRIFDLINMKEWEVRWSLAVSMIIFAVLVSIGFYRDFNNFEEITKTLITCMLGAMVGLIGFSLSGIAIIVSLFSKDEVSSIDRINGKGMIDTVLFTYSFLAKNIGVQCLIMAVLLFLLSSKLPIIPEAPFYLFTILEVYHIVFIVLYTIALIENCIKLYRIRNIYSEIGSTEKTIHDQVNEIKIDYIFSTLINNYDCSTEEVIGELLSFIEASNLGNKDVIVNYVKNQYSVK